LKAHGKAKINSNKIDNLFDVFVTLIGVLGFWGFGVLGLGFRV
jgi:hypothetical protein